MLGAPWIKTTSVTCENKAKYVNGMLLYVEVLARVKRCSDLFGEKALMKLAVVHDAVEIYGEPYGATCVFC